VDNTIAAYITQGDQYRAAKKYPEAIAAYQKANSLKPTVGAQSRLGLVYSDLKQYPNALAAFESALHLNPDNATSHFNLGATYLEMEQYENAVNAFKEALRLKRDLVLAINSLGIAYFNLDQYSEAVAAYKEAVRLEPNNAILIKNLGFAYLDLGRKEEALATYKELQRVAPEEAKKLLEDINASFGKTDDAQNSLFLAISFYDLGAKGYRYALRILRRIVLFKAEPDELGDAHYVMGQIYTAQKKPTIAAAEFEKAGLLFQEAIRLHPREADTHFSLGRVYIAQGRKDLALRVYKTLQTLDPEQAKTFYEEINKMR
jgi:tetratricopeptide (TPR) repeat protein